MMRKIRIKNKHFKLLILISLILLLLSTFIGYIVFAQTTIFNSPLKKLTWDISIMDIDVKHKIGNVTDKVNIENSSIDFDVTFNKPGDSITYTVYIENKGLINAYLSSITGIDTANSTIPKCIQYRITEPDNKVLKSKEITSFDITITWVNDSSSYEFDNKYSKTATINFNYIQN